MTTPSTGTGTAPATPTPATARRRRHGLVKLRLFDDERQQLEDDAKFAELSLSDYLRDRLGLPRRPPAKPRRKASTRQPSPTATPPAPAPLPAPEPELSLAALFRRG